MKSSTRLDSATFQLTPTRTRCDLVISAKGKTEKIASGLLNPFLAHLKTAQEQLAKGGYTIILEPDPSCHATWFTRGTVERFVRFVSTPEILERVYTIESEILQIEEAIVIQERNEVEMLVENQIKPVERVEGSRSVLDTSEEKAIVLFQPGVNSPEANGFTTAEENSKIKLMKVLEARKSVLQKEQGMAFARAVAAGFHVDDMPSLMSFAECFGALRLMDAGRKYTELWKKKHETGQWFEIEATDAIPSRSDFSPMNPSGIRLTDGANKQKEYGDVWVESHNGLCTDGSRKASSNMGADEKLCVMNQQPTGHQEYFQGQYPPHMYPPWPNHSPQSSLPVFQPYPIQGLPCYQNYAGNSPFFHPPYPIVEDLGLSTDKKLGQGRHSLGRKGNNVDSETGEVDSPNVRIRDDLDLDNSALEDQELQKKASKSSKKKPGMVVIRNINYISSRKHDSGGEESETDEEDGESEINNPLTNRKNSLKSSRTERNSEKLSNQSGKSDKEANILGKEANGHWQAFENFLLRDANEDAVDNVMLAKENEGKRRQKKVGDDALVFGQRDTDEIHEGIITGMDRISGKVSRIRQSMNDESVILEKGSLYSNGRSVDGRADVQHLELEGRRSRYKQTGNNDFMVHGQKNFVTSPSDPLVINEFGHRPNNLDRQSTNSINDSYIVSLKSSSSNQVENGGRNAIDVDSEFRSSALDSKNIFNRVASRLNYAPNELSMIPERGTEKRSTGYDRALGYEMQVQVGKNLNKESVMSDSKKESKRLDRDRKSKPIVNATDKRKTGGPIRRGKLSKLSPLDEARVRAEKLRTYKADLQKRKREKEEEEMKRLEALKMRRQKRISARDSFTSSQPSIPSQQTRKRVPTKLSPSSLRGSKFTDSEPGLLSPLQRFTRTNTLIGSIASKKAYKPSRANTESDLPGHRLSRSVSSLPEPKKENGSVTNGNKVSMARIRRLSDPQPSITPQQTRKHVPTKLSPSSLRGSKFTDSEPGSLSPLQRLTRKNTPIGSIASKKAYKPSRANTESDLPGHRLSRSVSSLPELKKENGSVTNGSKVSMACIRRLSEPKTSSMDNISSVKLQTIEPLSKQKKINGFEKKKVSAIVNHDWSKAATLSELKIRTSRKPDISLSGPVVKEMAQNVSSLTSEGAHIESRNAISHHSEADDNPVIDKTVLMLECGSGKPIDVKDHALDEKLQKSAGIEWIKQPSPDLPFSYEVALSNPEKETPKFSTAGAAEKPYIAPYARVSFLEDPSTRRSDYGKSPPTNLEFAAPSSGSKAQVSSFGNSKQGKVSEAIEMPEVKETLKGFKRLLQFGRKSFSPSKGEHNMELDNMSTHGYEADDSGTNTNVSIEVQSLKNFISEEESTTASTSQKSSRSFFLLSPFRSKHNEKKLTV